MVPWTKALLPQKQHQNINRCSSLPTARVWQALIHSHIKKKPPPSTTEKHTIPPLLSTHFPAWPMAETEAEPRLCLWMGHSGFLNTLSWHGWPANPPDSWILYQATLHYVAGEVWVWAKQINGPKKETIYIANGHAICQPEANLQPLKAILQPSLSHHSSIPSRSQISLANSRPLQWLVIPLTNGIQNAPNSASVPILKRSYTPNSQHFHSENDDLLSNLGLRVAFHGAPSRSPRSLPQRTGGPWPRRSRWGLQIPQRRAQQGASGIWWTSWENIQDTWHWKNHIQYEISGKKW